MTTQTTPMLLIKTEWFDLIESMRGSEALTLAYSLHLIPFAKGVKVAAQDPDPRTVGAFANGNIWAESIDVDSL